MSVFDWGGIPFRESGGYKSPFPAWGQDHSRAVVEYLINGQQQVAAAMALIGTTRFVNGAAPYLARTLPHAWPGSPSIPGLYCTGVPQCRPDATSLGVAADTTAAYSDWRLTVIYEYLPYDVLEDNQVLNPAKGNVPDESLLTRYVFRTDSPKEKQITYREGAWVFTDTKSPLASIVGRSWSNVLVNWKWYYVPYANVPRTYILANVGKVNVTAFDGCAAGTLLLRAPVWEVVRLPDGTRCVNVNVRAEFNPIGWNYFPDPLRFNNYFPVGRLNPADGTVISQPYPACDFPTLFRPSATG